MSFTKPETRGTLWEVLGAESEVVLCCAAAQGGICDYLGCRLNALTTNHEIRRASRCGM